MSTPSEIIVGLPAITRLVDRHPDVHMFFGYHESSDAFALALARPGFMVYELNGCWVITEDKGLGVREVHWCCPDGANVKTLRHILGYIFETTGALTLCGVTPESSPYARHARVINRAVGAEPRDGVYVLPRDRFLAYNARENQPEDRT